MSSVLNLNWMTLSLRPLSSDFFKFSPLRVAKMINFCYVLHQGAKSFICWFHYGRPKVKGNTIKIGYLHSANSSTDLFHSKWPQNTKMAFSKEAVKGFWNFLVFWIGTGARQIGVSLVSLVNFLYKYFRIGEVCIISRCFLLNWMLQG